MLAAGVQDRTLPFVLEVGGLRHGRVEQGKGTRARECVLLGRLGKIFIARNKAITIVLRILE